MNKKPFQKQLFLVVLIFSLLAITLSACGAEGAPAEIPDGGPKTWIEYPPEGETFSMGTIPIVVYASSVSGVSSIEIDVNGQALPAGQLSSLAGGSPTLVSTEVLWQPPAEGKYVIYASSGNGAPTILTFCVVNCDTPNAETPPELTSTPLPTLAPNEPTRTPTQIPSATPAPTSTTISYSKANVEFWVDPPYINEGECTTLYWNVTGDFMAVYLEGNAVNASGSDNECPSQSYTYSLHVDEMDNSTSHHDAYVEVYAVADTTGPTINWTNLSWSGCQFYGQADIYDDSGVAWAQFHYNKDGEGWNSIWMSGSWQSELGVSVGDGMGTVMPGNIQYYVIAADTLGNENESEISSYDYFSCDG